MSANRFPLVLEDHEHFVIVRLAASNTTRRKIISKNIRLHGTIGPEAQADFPLAMDWIAQGRIDVSPIITHRLPFTEVQKGFEMFVNERDKAIKIVLEY